MPAYRSNGRKYAHGAPNAFQASTPMNLHPYTQPHADACAGLVYSVSNLSLDEARAAWAHTASSDNHFGDPTLSTMFPWLPLPQSPAVPMYSSLAPAPYPDRKNRKNVRALQKRATPDPRTSKDFFDSILQACVTDPYATPLVSEVTIDEYAAMESSLETLPKMSTAVDLHDVSLLRVLNQLLPPHDDTTPATQLMRGLKVFQEFKKHMLAARGRSVGPRTRRSVSDRRSKLHTTVKELGNRLARTKLEDPQPQVHQAHAATGSRDVGRYHEAHVTVIAPLWGQHCVSSASLTDDVRMVAGDEWVPSWASSSEESGSDYNSSDAEL